MDPARPSLRQTRARRLRRPSAVERSNATTAAPGRRRATTPGCSSAQTSARGSRRSSRRRGVFGPPRLSDYAQCLVCRITRRSVCTAAEAKKFLEICAAAWDAMGLEERMPYFNRQDELREVYHEKMEARERKNKFPRLNISRHVMLGFMECASGLQQDVRAQPEGQEGPQGPAHRRGRDELDPWSFRVGPPIEKKTYVAIWFHCVCAYLNV